MQWAAVTTQRRATTEPPHASVWNGWLALRVRAAIHGNSPPAAGEPPTMAGPSPGSVGGGSWRGAVPPAGTASTPNTARGTTPADITLDRLTPPLRRSPAANATHRNRTALLSHPRRRPAPVSGSRGRP